MGTNRPDIHINQGNVITDPSTGYTYLRDAREWGSIGVGVSDSQPVLQQAINDCVAADARRLFIPRGCKILKPLLVYKFYAGNYVGVQLELFSDSGRRETGTYTIEAMFTDGFAIGIQHGKAASVKGISIKGQFVTPKVDMKTFMNLPFDSFTDGVCTDSRYKPYTGIAIDPVSNSASNIPSDGGYASMIEYYQGGGGVAGSTGVVIENCTISSVVVGVCSSPNGFTRNAEITTIEKCQFQYNKLCISGGQDQEKANTVRDIDCWYDSHTVFATGKYGATTPGNWNIDTVNLAGRVVRVIDNQQSGYFSSVIKNVYAESLGSFGTISNFAARTGASVKDCQINFAYPSEAGLITPLINAGGNVVFDNCVFRYYGQFDVPMPIQGDATYTNCTFSGFPMLIGNYIYARFINCFANTSPLGLTGIKTHSGGANYYPYGDWKIIDYGATFNVADGVPANIHTVVKSTSQEIYTSFTPDTNVNVTVANGSFTFDSSNFGGYYVNGLVQVGDSTNVGLVTNISATTITISYLPSSFTSGTYSIKSFHPVLYFGVFIGDITANSNQILNCKGALGYYGLVIKNPYGGSRYLRILSVNGTTITFYGTVTSTKAGAVFGNYSSMEVYTEFPNTNAFPAGIIVRRGDKIITQKGSENSIEYIVEKGGFLQGDADTRKATLAQTSGTWTGTQAQYDAIVNPSDDIIYYITNTAP